MGRRAEMLEKMRDEAPLLTFPFAADISDTKAFNDAYSEIIKKFSELHLIILCAGIGELNPTFDVKTELETIQTNIVGWTNAVDAIYQTLQAQNYGQLVTITSVGGMQPTAVAPSYSASKAFQINYTKSLQAKAKKAGFCITEIRPGLVDTRMAKGEGLFWVMPLSKVIPQIIKAIEKKKKLCIVSKRWRILNYVLKHFI